MSRVVHFEIQADDLERARTFYGDVFGWEFQDWSSAVGGAPYWGIDTGPDDQPGINGGLLQRPAATPGTGQGTNAYVCTMGVEDYDADVSNLCSALGKGIEKVISTIGIHEVRGYARQFSSIGVKPELAQILGTATLGLVVRRVGSTRPGVTTMTATVLPSRIHEGRSHGGGCGEAGRGAGGGSGTGTAWMI